MIVQTGFWLHTPPSWRNEPLQDGVHEWLDSQPFKPFVLSFSSQPVKNPAEVLDCHLDAARSLGRGLIVQGGWADWRSEKFLAASTSGHALRLPAGPQEALFQRAAAIIHHGGIGTTARALAAGAPQLIEPYGNDQFYNARQLQALGAGVVVNPHALSAGGLAQVIEKQLLRESVQAAATECAKALADESGVLEGALCVERWIAEPHRCQLGRT
jgi:UDP:flavonoid glycosyltransferase YjiC (YdhE family)